MLDFLIVFPVYLTLSPEKHFIYLFILKFIYFKFFIEV